MTDSSSSKTRFYSKPEVLLGDLRGGLCSSGLCRQLRAVAADEIEQLTRERDKWHSHYQDLLDDAASVRQEMLRRDAERDRLRAALTELRDEIEAIMHGEHGADWADEFGPLFDLVQQTETLSSEPSAHETTHRLVDVVGLKSPEETIPPPKRAYYETHEPPHCPTCECGAEKATGDQT